MEQLTAHTPGTIYVPGKGEVNPSEWRQIEAAAKACNQYDERLYFKKHETGQWAAYMQMPRGSDPPEVPVLGFGYDIPHPDEIQKRLYEADTLRHGEAMLDAMNRRNEELRKEKERVASEKTGDAAERVEQQLRGMGQVGYHKSFRNHTFSNKRKPHRSK